jgi:CheY-like chemotaxis protein
MGKTILLIESDAAFAREISAALEARGFAVRTSGDGKEGLDLARDLRPDAVVLCVELPRMSGYSVCNKLKKDDALRSIPLLVISAEATPETFEQHRKLKTRAEDYLIKPFPPETLAERVVALTSGEPTAVPEEEVVTLADVEIEGAQPPDLPPLQLTEVVASGHEDDDLRLLDDAFDQISREEAEPPPPQRPAAAREAAPAPEPAEVVPEDLVEPVAATPAQQGEGTPRATPSPATATLPPARDQEAEVRALREDVSRVRAAADTAAQDFGARDAELRAAKARLEAVQGTVRKLEADLRAARDEARRAQERTASLERDVGAARARLEEAEMLASSRGAEVADAVSRAESAERALEELRAELEVTRAEADGLRGEAERRSGDLRKRVQELETQAARHEERVVKAYQKIKNDEKLKEKTRKALTIALQLLDERLPLDAGGDPPAPGAEHPTS